MTVHLVCGPPGAGKTTHVAQHAGPDDVVIDLDEIRRTVGLGQASMWRMAAERAAAEHKGSDVWVIRTLADPAQRADAAARLGAEDVQVLATPAALAKDRVLARDGTDEAHAPIEDWWSTYQPRDGETTIHPDRDGTPDKEAHTMPQPTYPTPKEVQGQNAHELEQSTDESGGDDPQQQEAPGSQEQQRDRGYPENTPLAEMTTEQQVAYWKHQSRKHERRANERADYEQLAEKASKWEEAQRAGMSDTDRALEEARAQARNDALREARQESAERLVAAEFRAAARDVDPKVLEGFLEDLNFSRYIGEDMSVDTARITDRVNGLPKAGHTIPAPPNAQGFRRFQGSSSVEAGRAMYEARHGAEPKP